MTILKEWEEEGKCVRNVGAKYHLVIVSAEKKIAYSKEENLMKKL